MKLTRQQQVELFTRLANALHRAGALADAVAGLPPEARASFMQCARTSQANVAELRRKFDLMTDEELDAAYLTKVREHGLTP
ncbi:MAG: hypothetical protein M5U25_01960 [Planctomycetota bacterium]|nr:hypothetical protein [Planctomycetota bacterium]